VIETNGVCKFGVKNMEKHQIRIARRQARLAQNLRANLLRRKQQARQRQAEEQQIQPQLDVEVVESDEAE